MYLVFTQLSVIYTSPDEMTQGIIKHFQHQVAWPLLESHIKNLAESHWCHSQKHYQNGQVEMCMKNLECLPNNHSGVL